jgi:hypothetical protein
MFFPKGCAPPFRIAAEIQDFISSSTGLSQILSLQLFYTNSKIQM